MAEYNFAFEVGVEYLTDLQVHDASEPLCGDIRKRLKMFFDERVMSQYPEWEVISHNLTMVGNHLLITLLLRRPKG